MKITRRNLLTSSLFGAGYIGLRSLATGIPAAFLMKGPKAFADGSVTCGDASKAQYIIMSTSSLGDPINANCPGTYSDSGIQHCADPTMPATPLMLGSVATTAAQPWASTANGGQLPQSVLDRTTFWHTMTNTPVHPKEPDVLKLMGATTANEMLPSVLAKALAPCLNTVQTQPISLGATSPSEGLSFNGAPLPILPPTALAATLTMPQGPLANLAKLRQDTLAKLDDLYRNGATPAQAKYIDSLVLSQTQVNGIRTDLLGMLSGIQDNSVGSQITAAIALIQMNITPVIAIHIPFGGDNHHDTALGNEAMQTVSGVQTIAQLMQALASATPSLTDKVTFMTLNVFGRTLAKSTDQTNGRQHNPNHHVGLTIGKPWRAGIVGGVKPVSGDYGAMDIVSSTGAGKDGGDIAAADTLASFGKTVMAAVGVDSATIDTVIPTGKVVHGALA